MPKGKKGAKEPRAHVDAFMNSIRQKIHEFYVVKKECPSIRRLLIDLRKDNFLHCRHDFLLNRLHKIGFKWEKCSTNRKIFIERPYISYVTSMKNKSIEKKKYIYIYIYIYIGIYSILILFSLLGGL